MFALVDCNNFYASCEALFDPRLRDRPLVVLSNNDGCVVARSKEAKAIGVPMGAPWFKLREMTEQHGIVALSSNYALYADLSNRVVEVLSAFTPNLEVYSIDESFLDLTGFVGRDLVQYGQQIRARVLQWLGLPVCVGIAPTKTLAKLANHVAKKRSGYAGVCDLTRLSGQELDTLCAEIEVGEVWGVGRRIEERLSRIGVRSVQDLRQSDPDKIRAQFSVVLERTVRELRGEPCLALEEVAPPKQQIMASRSFGNPVYEIEELREAIANHVGRAAEKLRAQECEAGAVTVMIRTNVFKPEEPQYQRTVTSPLAEPTADTRTLLGAALAVLEGVFRPGYAYKKAGIMLSEISPVAGRQASLFASDAQNERSAALMTAMDAINRKWGRGTLRPLAAAGEASGWKMRRERLSPAYTTNWDEIPGVSGEVRLSISTED